MDLLEKKEFDTSRGLHYRYYVSPASQADNSKPAILLCHGWPDSADLWQYVVPHLLKSKNRLVIPDLLGAGGTSKPTDPASFEIKAMCQDVAEILDAEKIKQKIIPLGHDWGSFFASRFYMLHKPRTAGIILLNVAYMPPRSEPYNLEAVNAQTEKAFGNPLYAYWELFADPKVGEVMDPNLESVYYAIHGDEPEQMKNLFCTHGAIRKFISAGRKDVPLRPYAQDEKFKNSWLAEKKEAGMTSQNAWYRAMKENYHLATEKTLDAKITGPYLFIGCDGDAVCRQEFAQMAVQAGLVKEEQMTVKELHSGHWCPYEKPEEMAGIVLEWLKKEGFSG